MSERQDVVKFLRQWARDQRARGNFDRASTADELASAIGRDDHHAAPPGPSQPQVSSAVRAARVDPPPVQVRRRPAERRCPVVSPAGPRCAMSEGHPGGHNCIGPWADDGDACRP